MTAQAAKIHELYRNTFDDDAAPDHPEEKQNAVVKALSISQPHIVELWHTSSGEPMLTTQQKGVHVHLPLKSGETAEYLGYRYFQAEQRPMSEATQRNLMSLLSAKAKYEGTCHEVFSRIAHFGGDVYVDLGDESRRAVRISASMIPGAGFEVIEPQFLPVRFRRNRAVKALPHPVAGGSLDSLWTVYPNVSEEVRPLVIGWLLGCFLQHGSRAHLEIVGGQGSGKSTLGRYMLSLIDPNDIAMRSMPKSEQDLIISAQNRIAAGFDNLSVITREFADAFCRLSTGAGIGNRTLHTDADETLLKAIITLLWTGIEPLATRQADLQDRTITVYIGTIDSAHRETEQAILDAENVMRPQHLGALYHAVAVALSRQDEVDIRELPRLSDFALWVEAAAPAFGWEPGEFLATFESSRANASAQSLDSSLTGQLVLQFMLLRSQWEGTASDLLNGLRARADESTLRNRRFPKDATRLSGDLRRNQQALASVGIVVGFDRSGSSRGVTLSRAAVKEPARQ
jgi:hypothetical protein